MKVGDLVHYFNWNPHRSRPIGVIVEYLPEWDRYDVCWGDDHTDLAERGELILVSEGNKDA